jgi:hypothetical protein
MIIIHVKPYIDLNIYAVCSTLKTNYQNCRNGFHVCQNFLTFFFTLQLNFAKLFNTNILVCLFEQYVCIMYYEKKN